jgi:arylsulfatase A-like enzyme/Flp pilus assembly protein TadD
MRPFLWPAAIVLALGSAACGRESAPPTATRPNIVLITVDTLRADRLGRGFTPEMDAIAASGRRFENARTTVPLTLPAHVTIMTGTLPTAHGVRENGVVFREGDGTLAAALREGGYKTGAFVGAYVLNRRFGLASGFDTYDDQVVSDPQLGTRLEAERRGELVVDAALGWLRGVSAPFFLWIHLYDPHAPYEPPAGFRAAAGGDPYNGEVAYADAQLRRVTGALRERGLSQSTLIVVTGDHGEGLGEHGETTHGMLAYDTTLRVPLLVAGPQVRAERITAPVSLADIAGSLLRRAGRPLPARVSRVDLFGTLPPDGDVYAETQYPRTAGWHPVTALAGERWKLLLTSEEELYDLQSDPQEARNVAAGHRSIVDGMRAVLGQIETTAVPRDAGAVPPDAAERLRALGYVGSSTHTPVDPRAANPARAIDRWTEFEGALAALNAGRPTTALPALRRLSDDFPEAVVFRSTYARALKDSGKLRESLAVYRALAKDRADPGLFHDLAVAAREAGDLAEAARAEEAALALDPANPAALNGHGLVHAQAGRTSDAATAFERAAAADPGNASYWTNLGNARRELGDLAAAESAYKRALSVDAGFPDAANGLGVVLVQRGAPRDAVPWFTRALDRAPDLHEARLNLGIAYQESGDRGKAAEIYRELLAKAPRTATREREAAAALLKQIK